MDSSSSSSPPPSSSSSLSSSDQLDIVVWGATGFTGRLTAEYLVKNHSDLRFGFAGRSKGRLEAVCDAIPGADAKVEVIVASLDDEASLQALVGRTRVVVSTAGPFARLGEPMVRACAESGTDYVDITGEVHWVKRMSDKYHETAQRSGALIISCCGFDSVPSDLGAFALTEHIKDTFGECTSQVDAVFQVKGGVSGGTIASVLNIFDTSSASELKAMMHPHLLTPEAQRPANILAHDYDVRSISYSDAVGAWTMPFIMAGVNTKVVRKTQSLIGYGSKFTYNETMSPGGLCITIMTAVSMLLCLALFPFSVGRWIIRLVAPAPGQGPSPDMLANGWFKTTFTGRSEKTDQQVRVIVRGTEPGYTCTSLMLAEAACCLAKERDSLPFQGGCLTPAAALGHTYIRRLTKTGDMHFDIS